MKPILPAVPAHFTSLALAILFSGCASSLSGIGGSEALSCKAPEGVVCNSVSGVYANSAAIAARSTAVSSPLAQPVATQSYLATLGSSVQKRPSSLSSLSSVAPAAPPLTSATRSSPRVLRLWVAPWEDSDGDLHDEATVNVLIDNGRWLIDPIRPAARHRLDAVRPPATSSPTAAKAAPEPNTSTPSQGFGETTLPTAMPFTAQPR